MNRRTEMTVSDKLAYEIYVIIFFHVIAVVILFSFSLYLYLRAKKTPLLYSYLAVAATILLWMISKFFKTVAPTEGLRWFFITTQYLGAEFLGLCLVVFAYIYANNSVPSRKRIAIWAALPLLSYVIILTNPLHMGFYSYFDFYKDRFGPLFFIVQSIQYVYWIIGILMLSRGFTEQPSFHGKKVWAVLFAAITLIPVGANLYYILFKLDVFRWIFPFPVFDFTPIAGTAALILFTIPAMTFRFFDISPISYAKLFDELPRGLVFMDRRQILYEGNVTFYRMFDLERRHIGLVAFINQLGLSDAVREDFHTFLAGAGAPTEYEVTLPDGRLFKTSRKPLKNNRLLLCFTDITQLVKTNGILASQQAELVEMKHRLDVLAENNRALSAARAKAQAAQDMHDILGHSLTVVIATADMAAAETDSSSAVQKLAQVGELLTCSLNDLRNTLSGVDIGWDQTSLVKAVGHLKNERINVDIITQGTPYELSSAQTEAVFRLCQEAVTNAIKHGAAQTIHIIIRYIPDAIEVFAINDGMGCQNISKSYGLMGIENRIAELSGYVEFGSDGDKGFTIHACLPRVR